MRPHNIAAKQLTARLATVQLLAMDVDGVLTDGTLGYDGEGRVSKRFHVADGLGLVLLGIMGIEVAWISGRSDAIVAARARELKIPHLLQGVRDKGAALASLMSDLGVMQEQAAYIGDDWNDLMAFAVCGLRVAVVNADSLVCKAANAITDCAGGNGAVREVCEALLEAKGLLADCQQKYIASLRGMPDGESSVRQ